jgi:hypothetical protein
MLLVLPFLSLSFVSIFQSGRFPSPSVAMMGLLPSLVIAATGYRDHLETLNNSTNDPATLLLNLLVLDTLPELSQRWETIVRCDDRHQAIGSSLFDHVKDFPQ